MSSNEKLTQAVTKRKSALAKKVKGGKSTPENLRLTRKQRKRAQRGLAKRGHLKKAEGAEKEAEKPG